MLAQFKENKVFYGSLILLVSFLVFGITHLEGLNIGISNIVNILNTKFAWFYIIVFSTFLIICIYLLISKYRNIKLGKDNDKPEYSFMSWFSMLFSAGMGIGLVFFGVAEPLSHYVAPNGLEGFSEEARSFAFSKTFLHWGISAWACYAILAMAIAYFQFRKDKPMLMSHILEPIIGTENRDGLVGTIIDIFTILATIAGIVSSLGLGTLQINGGLNYLFNVPKNIWVQLIIVGTVTACFLTSAVKGLDSGILKVSNANLILAVLLFLLCFIVGPTYLMFQNLFIGLKGYIPELIGSMNPTVSGEWYSKWTIYYWANWICWAPPVAIFIARISKGRTIKEFILGVLIVPTIVCMLWFAVFGTLGIEAPKAMAIEAVQVTETAFFKVIESYPLSGTISIIAIVLLATFFVTSADSATFVLGMLASKGDINPTAKRKVVLGSMISCFTLVFLVAGGIDLIQNISILAAFPFAFVMIGCIIAFLKALSKEENIPVKANKKNYNILVRIVEFLYIEY